MQNYIKITIAFLLPALFAYFLIPPLHAEELKRIEDNSFFIEEAYNQEPGVIQHIQTFQYMKDKTWETTFTQEWPVPGITHQLSYTIPVTHVIAPRGATGLGDLLLNYRYQLIRRDELAVSPRLSLILPTGNSNRGLGTNSVGFQFNMPLSVLLAERWVMHWNMGTTLTPYNQESGGTRADTYDFFSGASLIFIASSHINPMIEFLWESNESVLAGSAKVREDTAFVNPGLRFAINCKSGLQIIPAVTLPLGIGPSRGEYGIFGYISFEHSLWKSSE